MQQLWSRFEYSLDLPMKELINVGVFLTQSLQRSPTQLALTVPEGGDEDKLRLLPLDALSPLKFLAFVYPNEEDDPPFATPLATLCDPLYTNLACHCSTLWMEGYALALSEAHGLNLCDVLTRFTGVEQFRVRNVTCLGITQRDFSCLASLTDIELRNVRDVPVLGLLSATPSLKTLEMENCAFEIAERPSIIDSCLQSLVLKDYLRGWLAKVGCRTLSQLTLSGQDPGKEGDFDFIQRTQSIEEMHFGSMEPEDVRRLAVSASHIKDLTLSGDCHQLPRWVSETRSRLWFAQLRRLGIKSTCSCVTTAIEELVRARCLPRTHQESELVVGLEPLEHLSIEGSLAYSMATHALFQRRHVFRS